MAKDYRQDLTIEQMVYKRLPFLASTEGNNSVIGEFALEVMHELNYCFRIESEQIGNESEYIIIKRSIIADVICVYLLISKATGSTAGIAQGVTDGTTEAKILTKTVAGSVEVEWEQSEANSGGMITTANKLLESFKLSSRRKAKSIGCNIAWTNEDLELDQELGGVPAPFIVVSCKL